MSTTICPHCHASQEVASPALEAGGQPSCFSCGKTLPSRLAGPGATQKIGQAQRAETIPDSVKIDSLPSTLGPYEIKGIIGTGGMGIVYEGWDARLNRSVAVKTLKPELAKEPAFCERFLREARAAASLSHPNVTQIYFIGEEQGCPFFAMEFLQGKPLDSLLREEGKLSPSRATELIRQAALGLKAAATRGVIHRDIKPSNLVLTREGVLKVTDFGLAKLVVADSGLTLTGEVLGSPNYLAPEQASGAPADLRSDIYSLGATLYELLTGRPPFDGPTPVSIILKHVREPLRSPRHLSPDLPAPLVALTQRMLSKRAEDRPRDYDALLRELDRLLMPVGAPSHNRASLAGATVVRQTPERRAGGSSSGSWILASILALGAVAAWGFFRQSRGLSGTQPPAPTVQASISQFSAPSDTGGESRDDGGAPPAPTPDSSGANPLETRIVSTSAEVLPPQPGTGPHHRSIDLPPRLERLREAARANLQFVENSHEMTLDGRLRVKGSVYNSGLAAATEIKVHIILTDESGQVIATGEAPLSPPFLPSRQAGNFEVFLPDPHQSINIKAELSWNS